MLDNKTKALLIEYRKKAMEGWKCMQGNCHDKAINSHIIQKKRYLDVISNSENKVYCAESDFFSLRKISIKNRGTNQILSFPIYCAKHDNILYKRIETKGIDFNDSNAILRLCYRTGLSEIRKKEIIIKWYDMLIRDSSLSNVLDKRFLLECRKYDVLGIMDTHETLGRILADLKTDSENYSCFYREIEHTQICISSIFSLESTIDMIWRKRITGEDYDRLSPVFFYIIPISHNKDALLLIYETNKEEPVKRYLKAFYEDSEKQILKQISDLMFCQIENWVCSSKFYDKHIHSRLDYIESLISENAIILDEKKPLHFNIFEV